MSKNEVKHGDIVCVRDTEHAVRQCAAPSVSIVARPEAQRRDMPKKVKLFFRLYIS
ncbi:MAG: hypothetical protein NZ455_14985 [Bacteroidia bacterium]|nr:hypothetical protein [Bacteroidia bacterium]MDW8346837.1 hypothetical protein [Bacteroidia bacterium]